MSHRLRLLDIFEGHRHQKLALTISVLIFLILELIVYMAFAGQAGQKSRVVITDVNGNKVYETAGNTLTSYEKLVFENNHGPLVNYQMRLETEQIPFPFRAWVSTAVGVPVGLILLMAFLVRAYLSLMYGEEKAPEESAPESEPHKKRFGTLFHSVHNFSIFHIGGLIVLGVLLLWMVPNVLGDIARISVDAIRDYKWFFLGVSVFLAGLIVWVIYLRYKLSKQMLDNQLNLERFRVEQQLLVQQEPPKLLTHPTHDAGEPS